MREQLVQGPGNRLAVATGTSALVFHDATSAPLTVGLATDATAAAADVVALAFTASGSHLVMLTDDKRVAVWDVSGTAASLVAEHTMPKKLTSVLVGPLPGSAEGAEAAVIGDKTGEVWALPLPTLTTTASAAAFHAYQ